MEWPSVSIVIPVHNCIEDTVRCLESLKKMNYPNYDIIIIDDGSTDGTEHVLNINFPQVKILKGDGSLWWAGATNYGIKYALYGNSDYIFLLNNDVVVDKCILNILVKSAEKHPDSIIGSKIFYFNTNKIWFVGGGINWLRGGLYHIDTDEINVSNNTSIETEWLTGMMLINSKFFANLGLMDSDNFPQYWGDADFCLRARKKGYKMIVEPRSYIWHKCGELSKRSYDTRADIVKNLYGIRSRWDIKTVSKFYARHCPKKYLFFALISFYLKYSLLSIKSSRIPHDCLLKSGP